MALLSHFLLNDAIHGVCDCTYVGAVGLVEAQYGRSILDFMMDEVNCTGNETRLVDCPGNDFGVHDCIYNDHEEASVACVPSEYILLRFVCCTVIMSSCCPLFTDFMIMVNNYDDHD